MLDPLVQIQKMIQIGCTIKQIEAYVTDYLREQGERLLEKRAKTRERVRRYREKTEQDQRSCNALHSVTRENINKINDHVTRYERYINPPPNKEKEKGFPPEGPPPQKKKKLTPSNNTTSSEFLLTNDFETFWKAYPKRVGKGAARKAFAKAILKTDLDTMLQKIKIYSSYVDQAFTKNPSTWLNQECWLDEISPQSNARRLTPREQREANYDEVTRYLEEQYAAACADDHKEISSQLGQSDPKPLRNGGQCLEGTFRRHN